MKTSRYAAAAVLALAALALGHARADDEEEAKASPATQQARELQRKAYSELEAKKNSEAVESFRKLLDHLDQKKNEFPDFPPTQQKEVRAKAFYNMACAYARLGKKPEALETLGKAAEAGYYDWQLMEKDEDLASLREEPEYKEVLGKLRGMDKETEKLQQFVDETVSATPLFDFDFEVTTLEQEAVKLSDLKGKVVIVDCFGTWCPPCREEIPSFVKLAQNAKEKGEPVVIVGLAWERAEPTDEIAKQVKDFVAEKKIPYQVALMKEKDPVLDRIPGLNAFPTTLWIDKNGKVRGRAEGLLSFEKIEALTRRLLDDGAKKKPAPKKAPDAPKEEPAPRKDAPKADEPF